MSDCVKNIDMGDSEVIFIKTSQGEFRLIDRGQSIQLLHKDRAIAIHPSAHNSISIVANK